MNHVIVLHATSTDSVDAAERDLVAHDVRSLPLDGGFLVVLRTNDRLLRHRLALEDGVTVFPHVFSSIGLTDREAQLLGHGVCAGDTVERALLRVDDAYDHFHFHPHSL